MRQLSEKLLSKNKEIHIWFVDLQKAFDKIRSDVWEWKNRRRHDKK